MKCPDCGEHPATRGFIVACGPCPHQIHAAARAVVDAAVKWQLDPSDDADNALWSAVNDLLALAQPSPTLDISGQGRSYEPEENA